MGDHPAVSPDQVLMEHLNAAKCFIQAARDIVNAPTLLRRKFLLEALAQYDSRVEALRDPNQ